MKLIATRKSEQEHAALDPWTIVHFGLGLGVGLMDRSFIEALGLNVGYEVLENYFQRSNVGQRFFAVSSPENPANTVADMFVFQFGWWLGNRWNRTG